jgi:hypothetical protein
MRAKYVLALDQGAASSPAIPFDEAGRPVHAITQSLTQIYPKADGSSLIQISFGHHIRMMKRFTLCLITVGFTLYRRVLNWMRGGNFTTVGERPFGGPSVGPNRVCRQDKEL